MHHQFRAALVAAATLMAPLGAASFADDATKAPAPDNSQVNKRDNGSAAPSAEQQQNDKQSVELTRKIRRAITDDKSLSTYAHNVKIITENGQVVLKGPVRSADEKRQVEQAAVKAAAGATVKNELEVAP